MVGQRRGTSQASQAAQEPSHPLKSVRCPLCGGPLYSLPFVIGDLDIRRMIHDGTAFLCSECGYGGAAETTDDEPPRLRPVNIPEEMRPLVTRAKVKFAYESPAKQDILESKNRSGELPWWPVGAQWGDRTGRVTHSIDPVIRVTNPTDPKTREERLAWELRRRSRKAGRPRTVTYTKFSDALKAAKS